MTKGTAGVVGDGKQGLAAQQPDSPLGGGEIDGYFGSRVQLDHGTIGEGSAVGSEGDGF